MDFPNKLSRHQDGTGKTSAYSKLYRSGKDVSIRLYRWNKQEDRWENASRTVSCQRYFYSYIKKAGQEEPVNREAGKFFNDTKIKLVLL